MFLLKLVTESLYQRRIQGCCNIQDGVPLTIITNPSVLDVAAALDPPQTIGQIALLYSFHYILGSHFFSVVVFFSIKVVEEH